MTTPIDILPKIIPTIQDDTLLSWRQNTEETLSRSYPPQSKRLLNEIKGFKNYRKFKSSNVFTNDNDNRKKRKCAYIIAVVDVDFFKRHGGEQLDTDSNIFIADRNYNGEYKGETCAIIGINKHYVRHLFNDDSILYQKLKSSQKLVNIEGIQTLRAYRLEPLRQIVKSLFFVSEKDLLIFNIEPQGKGENANIYPTANICIPGGGMEKVDDDCFEKCAIREFEEETLIPFPKFYKNICRYKFILQDRISVYFMMRFFKEKIDNENEKKNELFENIEI